MCCAAQQAHTRNKTKTHPSSGLTAVSSDSSSFSRSVGCFFVWEGRREGRSRFRSLQSSGPSAFLLAQSGVQLCCSGCSVCARFAPPPSPTHRLRALHRGGAALAQALHASVVGESRGADGRSSSSRAPPALLLPRDAAGAASVQQGGHLRRAEECDGCVIETQRFNAHSTTAGTAVRRVFTGKHSQNTNTPPARTRARLGRRK